MKTADFKKGERVKYIPIHARGNRFHRDCESGVVSSTNEYFVFVKYDNATQTMISGDDPYTSQATLANDLVKLVNGGEVI